jgi:hypothetical protein
MRAELYDSDSMAMLVLVAVDARQVRGAVVTKPLQNCRSTTWHPWMGCEW